MNYIIFYNYIIYVFIKENQIAKKKKAVYKY